MITSTGPRTRRPKTQIPWAAGVRSFSRPGNPGVKREPLGEKDIDGRHVIGFRLTTAAAVIDVWGDPKTGMPVRLDMATTMMPSHESVHERLRAQRGTGRVAVQRRAAGRI